MWSIQTPDMEFRFIKIYSFFTLSNNDSMRGLKQEIIEKSDTLDEEKYESIDEDDS
jgi:hypothetical protein